jgi:hypothetical protein
VQLSRWIRLPPQADGQPLCRLGATLNKPRALQPIPNQGAHTRKDVFSVAWVTNQ